jgi:hypothetical protein
VKKLMRIIKREIECDAWNGMLPFIPMEKKIRELNLQGLCWDLGSYCFLAHAFKGVVFMSGIITIYVFLFFSFCKLA